MADGNQTGSDKPFYKSPAGIIFAPAVQSNGFGAPPMPGLRGKAPGVGGTIPSSSPSGSNGVAGKLLKNGGK